MNTNPAPVDVSTVEGVADAMLDYGATLADLHGITPQELDATYSIACEELAAGRLDEAFELAAFLVRHDPWDRRFHLALAICLQQAGQFASAARFYGQALALDATDAYCAYRMGECLLGMSDPDSAREAFEAAIKLSWIASDADDVRVAAQGQIDALGLMAGH